MATDFILIDGAYINTDDIRRISPGEGSVRVSLERRHYIFEVAEGTEEEWAAGLAAKIGRVIDTSDTPVETG